ncbi:MAG: LPXTG cell wall anchor domain-containing protein [Gammaproteobacteria bacterium]|nr:MAG: LPXTG cell wall anchor domain-containing protein [Gammaproteobacteria bacterium]
MNIARIIGILLLVVGALGLAYGGFSFTKETHKAEIGSLKLSVDEKEHVNIPTYAGVGLIIIGGLLLFVRRKV